jgi:hypothetical protein
VVALAAPPLLTASTPPEESWAETVVPLDETMRDPPAETAPLLARPPVAEPPLARAPPTVSLPPLSTVALMSEPATASDPPLPIVAA